MNPQKSPEITVQTLLALRKEDDAVRLITERLRVREMGPADHIRTKHEVKVFVESGDVSLAEQILTRARNRYQVQQSIIQGQSQQRGHRVVD